MCGAPSSSTWLPCGFPSVDSFLLLRGFGVVGEVVAQSARGLERPGDAGGHLGDLVPDFDLDLDLAMMGGMARPRSAAPAARYQAATRMASTGYRLERLAQHTLKPAPLRHCPHHLGRRHAGRTGVRLGLSGAVAR